MQSFRGINRASSQQPSTSSEQRGLDIASPMQETHSGKPNRVRSDSDPTAESSSPEAKRLKPLSMELLWRESQGYHRPSLIEKGGNTSLSIATLNCRSLAKRHNTSVLPPFLRYLRQTVQEEYAQIEMLKAGKLWREKGERSSGMFKRLASTRDAQREIPALYNSQGTLITTHEEKVEVIHQFYSDLYSPTPPDDAAIHQLLGIDSNRDNHLRISEDEQDALVAPFDLDDIIDASKRHPPQSSPGSDHLPYEILGFLIRHPAAKELKALYYRWLDPVLFERPDAPVISPYIRVHLHNHMNTPILDMGLLFPAARSTALVGAPASTTTMIFRTMDVIPRTFLPVDRNPIECLLLPIPSIIASTSPGKKLSPKLKTATALLNFASFRKGLHIQHNDENFAHPKGRTRSFRQMVLAASARVLPRPSSIAASSWNAFWALFLNYTQRNVLYRLVHRKIPTRSRRSQFNDDIDPHCAICLTVVKSMTHFFFYCEVKQHFWDRLIQEYLWLGTSVALVQQSIQTLKFDRIPVRLDSPTTFEPLVILTVASSWGYDCKL
ncbi:hypothetical protein MUCCIDRAFT_168366 [Mucor lusitanicus CBS 277.49]|uniref:Reverse transcriptase zinc-binding domain-containing protein n=1 Tax=Mucor lusitanicus CBS 277.49 TaxID=747725 RepID=A0A168GCH8_MUCCL|nr:hypothetical protein MUCCIDRAFT_168366 [Mucor lusitanicus CBS 277.49]